jgi:(p)ppGpp synthase/HD superfamily hydrolase
LSTVLNTGDIVEIETHKSKFTANRHWLDFLHNPSSKQKLNRFLNQNSKDLKVKKAEETLNKKLHDL